MSNLARYVEAFRTLPRATQWAAMAGCVIVLFLLWDTTIRPAAESWRGDADAMQRDLETVRSGTTLARTLGSGSMKQKILAYGPVRIPGDEADAAAALNQTVNDILKSFSVSDDSFDMGVRGRLPKNALPGVAEGKRVSRLSGELRFESSPEDAISIIAALESSPDVEAVTAIQMSKLAGRKVKIRLSLESWALTVAARRGGA